jgi:hypothetical protein
VSVDQCPALIGPVGDAAGSVEGDQTCQGPGCGRRLARSDNHFDSIPRDAPSLVAPMRAARGLRIASLEVLVF